jgi:hypothetical protein
VAYGAAGSAGIPADNDIFINRADCQSDLERETDQIEVSQAPDAGSAE